MPPPPRKRTQTQASSPSVSTEVQRRQSWWFDPDATTITELDPDGLPVGMEIDKTRFFRAESGVPRKRVVLWLWIAVLVLSFYGAKDLQTAVVHDEGLAQRGWLVGLVGFVYRAADVTGPAKLRDLLDSAFSSLKQKTPDLGGAEVAAVETAEPVVPEGPKVGAAELAAARNRVLIVGASSIQFYMGAELERRLEQYQGTVTHRFGKLGTGLARPDTFDWFKHLPGLFESFKPTVVIAQFGGNDGQPVELENGKVVLFGTDEWKAEYRARVQKVVKLGAAANAKTVMLGMQITRIPKHSDKLKLINQVTKEATESAGGMYVDTWDLAADLKGESRATIVYEGKTGQMYLGDGIHYGRLGAAFVAQRLCWQLERYLPLVPKDPALAMTMKLDLDSVARAEKTSYLAFVPQKVAGVDEKYPVLFLLHGASGSWTDFSVRAHGVLQAFAGKQKVVVVTPDGTENGWYLDSLKVPGAGIETYVMREVLPDVEKRLPVTKKRGIGGISMGGNGAIVLAIKSPGTFLSVSSMSGAVDLSKAATRPALIERLGPYAENQAAWLANSALQLVKAKPDAAKGFALYFTVGSDDVWAGPNRALDAALDELRITHEFKESPGDHGWAHWLEVLPSHLEWHAGKLKAAK